MDNQMVLNVLRHFPELKIIKHEKSELFNVECITRKPHHRRENVVSDISETGNSFKVYANGKWVSKNQLGIDTLDQLMEWVRNEIELLSR